MKKAKKTKKAVKAAPAKAPKAPVSSQSTPQLPEELNARQREFVRRYHLHKNASRAYREAGYTSNSANVEACKLLTKPNIQAYLAELEKEAADQFKITKEMLIDELAAIAFGHVGKVMTWTKGDMKFIPSDELSPREMAFIESISVSDTEFGRTLKMTTLAGQKQVALRALGEITGLWGKGKNGTGSGPDKEARKAALARIRDYLAKRTDGGGS